MLSLDQALRQGTLWPSESKGADIFISDMEPQYAFRAWWKLRRNLGPEAWESLRLSPLATALLGQALNDDMVYADTLRPTALFEEDELLERCYHAIVHLESVDPMIHTIRKAAIMARIINSNKETP